MENLFLYLIYNLKSFINFQFLKNWGQNKVIVCLGLPSSHIIKIPPADKLLLVKNQVLFLIVVFSLYNVYIVTSSFRFLLISYNF